MSVETIQSRFFRIIFVGRGVNRVSGSLFEQSSKRVWDPLRFRHKHLDREQKFFRTWSVGSLSQCALVQDCTGRACASGPPQVSVASRSLSVTSTDISPSRCPAPRSPRFRTSEQIPEATSFGLILERVSFTRLKSARQANFCFEALRSAEAGKALKL